MENLNECNAPKGFSGMPFIMKEEVAFNLINITFFCFRGTMFETNDIPNLILRDHYRMIKPLGQGGFGNIITQFLVRGIKLS